MRRAMAIVLVMSALVCAAVAATKNVKPDAAQEKGGATDPRMKGARRQPAMNGWTQVHLEGTPREIGYQHGMLLAAEIEDLQKVFALEL